MAASPLGQRRKELEAQLERIAASLVATSPADEVWLERLRPIVSAGVAQLQNRLANLPPTPNDQWEALTEIGHQVQRLAGEALAFVGGVAVRRQGLDDGACDLADAMLRIVGQTILVGYQPVTVPASGEYVDVMSEVIRVRYPGAGVWDLPVVLHEFGHYLVPRVGLKSPTPPVKSIIAREAAIQTKLGRFAEELWADTFATYVGGPAYVFSLVARLDPTDAHEDAMPSHPAPAKRAAAVFATLDALQAAWVKGGRRGGSLGPFQAGAVALWEDRLRSADPPPRKREAESSSPESLTAEFLAILDAEWVGARYATAQPAEKLSRALVDDTALPGGCSLVDVLNGGWLARRSVEIAGRGDKVDAITDRLSELCANIASGGGEPI